MLALKDFLEPMSPSSPRTSARGSSAGMRPGRFRGGFRPDLRGPASSDGITCVFYNKHLLGEAGRRSGGGLADDLRCVRLTGLDSLASGSHRSHSARTPSSGRSCSGGWRRPRRLLGHRRPRHRRAQLRRRTPGGDRRRIGSGSTTTPSPAPRRCPETVGSPDVPGDVAATTACSGPSRLCGSPWR